MSARYAVFCPVTGRYVTHGTGTGLGWTLDRDEADEAAAMNGGVVVDADDFSANWPLYVLMAALAGEMPVEVATRRIPAEWLVQEYVRNQDAPRSGT
ncbi:MAG TPA: hypothetical protein VGI97_00740 [Gemmatimonadaceae bacterium]